MSHWKTYQNNVLKNTDLKMLQKAVENLGLGLDTSVKQITNAYGRDSVDMAFTKNGHVLSLGLKLNKNGVYELVGDQWGTGVDQAKLVNQIAQQYNKENIVSKLKKTSQYSIADITTNEKKEIEITVACL